MEQLVAIPTRMGELAGVLHLPAQAQQERVPLVVIYHGFVSSRVGSTRLFVQAARLLEGQGLAVLRFDFAGCGESEGDYGAGGFDKLVEQAHDVLAFVRRLDIVDTSRLHVIGHSLGGAVATTVASTDHRLRSVTLWAAVAHPFQEIVKIIGAQAYAEACESGAVGHNGFRLTKRFFDALEKQRPLQALQKVTAPILILHGDRDDEVPISDSTHYLETALARPSRQGERAILRGGDHTFSQLAIRAQLFEVTSDWLARQS